MRQLLASASLLALVSCQPAYAQNAPLSQLPARGAVQTSDLIPIEPAAGPQLMATTVQALQAAVGGGTVTGVTLTLPAFTCATTGTGALTIACAAVAPTNQVYAGPTSGSAAAPTFRALAAADLPTVPCADLPSLTGAVTTAPGACGTTITPSGVTAGSYASPSSVSVNAAGQVTAITAGPMTGTGGTFYVNSAAGSDSNTCLASTAACLTIAHALSLIPPVTGGGGYTINIADGTYAEGVCANYPLTSGGSPPVYPVLSIIGDDATQANVVITGQCGSGNIASAQGFGRVTVTLDGITFNPTTATKYCVQGYEGALFHIKNVSCPKAAYSFAAIHMTEIMFQGTINIAPTTACFFSSSNSDITNNGSATIAVTLGIGVSLPECLHADVNSEVQISTGADLGLSFSGSLTFSGAGSVVKIAHEDSSSTVQVAFSVTANNPSTPGNSSICEAYRSGECAFDGPITASNFTYKAWLSDNANFDGSNTAAFANVGAAHTQNGADYDGYGSGW